jgi:hypothetical protein
MSTWYWPGSKGRRDPSEDFPPPAFSDSRGIVVRQTGSWQEKALCETVVDSSERIVDHPEVIQMTVVQRRALREGDLAHCLAEVEKADKRLSVWSGGSQRVAPAALLASPPRRSRIDQLA